MSENPNPRSFRWDGGFIDLEQVQTVNYWNVWLVGRKDPIELNFNESTRVALLDALEIYRSGR